MTVSWQENSGHVVIGFSGGDPERKPWHIGLMRGYMPEPTVIIEGESGEQVHWAVSLCRPATHEEALAFWRERAEKAEAKLAALMEPAKP